MFGKWDKFNGSNDDKIEANNILFYNYIAATTLDPVTDFTSGLMDDTSKACEILMDGAMKTLKAGIESLTLKRESKFQGCYLNVGPRGKLDHEFFVGDKFAKQLKEFVSKTIFDCCEVSLYGNLLVTLNEYW